MFHHGWVFLVAGAGFERCDLLGMNQVSYHCSTPQCFMVLSGADDMRHLDGACLMPVRRRLHDCNRVPTIQMHHVI